MPQAAAEATETKKRVRGFTPKGVREGETKHVLGTRSGSRHFVKTRTDRRSAEKSPRFVMMKFRPPPPRHPSPSSHSFVLLNFFVPMEDEITSEQRPPRRLSLRGSKGDHKTAAVNR